MQPFAETKERIDPPMLMPDSSNARKQTAARRRAGKSPRKAVHARKARGGIEPRAAPLARIGGRRRGFSRGGCGAVQPPLAAGSRRADIAAGFHLPSRRARPCAAAGAGCGKGARPWFEPARVPARRRAPQAILRPCSVGEPLPARGLDLADPRSDRAFLCGRMRRPHNGRSAAAGISLRTLVFFHRLQQFAGLALGAQPDFGDLALRLGGGAAACDGGWRICASHPFESRQIRASRIPCWHICATVAPNGLVTDPEDAGDLALRRAAARGFGAFAPSSLSAPAESEDLICRFGACSPRSRLTVP